MARPPVPRHARQPRPIPPAPARRSPRIRPNDIDGPSMLPGRHQWDIDIVSGRALARIRGRRAELTGPARLAGRTGRLCRGRAPAAWPWPRAQAAASRQGRADGSNRYIKLTAAWSQDTAECPEKAHSLVLLPKSRSPHSSGERATASGAVSAGSNPAGGASY